MSAFKVNASLKPIAAAILFMIFVSGCAKIPIRDGELVMGKDTTATIEDMGVARLNSRF